MSPRRRTPEKPLDVRDLRELVWAAAGEAFGDIERLTSDRATKKAAFIATQRMARHILDGVPPPRTQAMEEDVLRFMASLLDPIRAAPPSHSYSLEDLRAAATPPETLVKAIQMGCPACEATLHQRLGGEFPRNQWRCLGCGHEFETVFTEADGSPMSPSFGLAPKS